VVAQRLRPSILSAAINSSGTTFTAITGPSEEADHLYAGDRHRERGHHHAGRQRGGTRELGIFT
jgi:hypothetical protein